MVDDIARIISSFEHLKGSYATLSINATECQKDVLEHLEAKADKLLKENVAQISKFFGKDTS